MVVVRVLKGWRDADINTCVSNGSVTTLGEQWPRMETRGDKGKNGNWWKLNIQISWMDVRYMSGRLLDKCG